jgi:hypothetical protein
LFSVRASPLRHLSHSNREEPPVQFNAAARDPLYWVYYTRWRKKLQPKSRIFSPALLIFWYFMPNQSLSAAPHALCAGAFGFCVSVSGRF